MEDIAAALGKKKSFLYYYYPSKSEVIVAVIEDELGMLNKMIHDAADKGATPAEKIRNYLEARIDCLTKQIASYANARPIELFAEPGSDAAGLLTLRKEFDRDEE
jgi:AcrR family transcriptional regulator